jgi:hypothetical protein
MFTYLRAVSNELASGTRRYACLGTGVSLNLMIRTWECVQYQVRVPGVRRVGKESVHELGGHPMLVK